MGTCLVAVAVTHSCAFSVLAQTLLIQGVSAAVGSVAVIILLILLWVFFFNRKRRVRDSRTSKSPTITNSESRVRQLTPTVPQEPSVYRAQAVTQSPGNSPEEMTRSKRSSEVAVRSLFAATETTRAAVVLQNATPTRVLLTKPLDCADADSDILVNATTDCSEFDAAAESAIDTAPIVFVAAAAASAPVDCVADTVATYAVGSTSTAHNATEVPSDVLATAADAGVVSAVCAAGDSAEGALQQVRRKSVEKVP
jgi:hypothetical protein